MENTVQTDAPVTVSARIASLDILRGVALLGVLLLNILGFGMASAGYFHPLVGLGKNPELNYAVWGTMNLFFEGSMRGLFSLLFGAGIVLFATGFGTRKGKEKGALLHYKRTFFLLLFGMFDSFVLLWTGDILILYAMAGALLYPLRNARPKTLLILSATVLLCTSILFAVSGVLVEEGRDAAARIDADPSAEHSAEERELAALWTDSENQFSYNESAMEEELDIRRGSYLEIADYSAKKVIDSLLFFTPVYMLWDCVGMMLLGMGLYRMGVLSAQRSKKNYLQLAIGGFALGLAVNGFELFQAVDSDFDAIVVSGYFQGTYQLGRVAMSMGWLGLIMLFCQGNLWSGLKNRLAAVGRMALSNYLLHSLICLVLFTGAGFGLIGVFERWELYVIVLLIWMLQLALSPWWLKRYSFGPAEWLWRSLTYGSMQKWRIKDEVSLKRTEHD
ncbi:MAG: DUF418 domain-containing protein [Candidatus Poseidoniales archaeon]|nr:MAG: DUF418 domain-containing protein [Candidatus Poseidoniales archaeon]